tara:strand:+ start:5843 stop:6049 length:207 start_codon:yes stop_codon:yes gene_type:complete
MRLTKYDLAQLRKDRKGRKKETLATAPFKYLEDDQASWRKQKRTLVINTYHQEDGKWTQTNISNNSLN